MFLIMSSLCAVKWIRHFIFSAVICLLLEQHGHALDMYVIFVKDAFSNSIDSDWWHGTCIRQTFHCSFFGAALHHICCSQDPSKMHCFHNVHKSIQHNLFRIFGVTVMSKSLAVASDTSRQFPYSSIVCLNPVNITVATISCGIKFQPIKIRKIGSTMQTLCLSKCPHKVFCTVSCTLSWSFRRQNRKFAQSLFHYDVTVNLRYNQEYSCIHNKQRKPVDFMLNLISLCSLWWIVSNFWYIICQIHCH